MIKRIITISAVTILMLTATAGGQKEAINERLSEGNDKRNTKVTEETGDRYTASAGNAVSDIRGNIHSMVQAETATSARFGKFGKITPKPVKEEINNDRGTEGTIQDNSESAWAGETGGTAEVDAGDGISGTSGYTDPTDDGLGAETESSIDSGDDYTDTESSSGEPEEPVATPERADGDNETELGDNGGYSGGDEGNQPEPESDSETDEANEPMMEYLGDWTVSFYCPCWECCGSWSGGPTASGAMPSAWWTVATSGLDFGTILYVDGLGTFEVQDRGTEYGWLDVYVSSHDEALANGLQNRSVYIVR